MSFQPPTFNLTCEIWNGPWATRTLRITEQECNLAWGKRISYPTYAPASYLTDPGSPKLLLPALTDIRDMSQNIPETDYVEVPSGTGRWYRVMLVDDVGKGFDNEYRIAGLAKISQNIDAHWNGLFWPIPMP